MGLLEKAQQRKQDVFEKPRDSEISILKELPEELKSKKRVHPKIKIEKELQKDLLDERKGFGWKGLGSRRILFDNERKEYLYEVIEPRLTEKQEQTNRPRKTRPRRTHNLARNKQMVQHHTEGTPIFEIA
jgi:hypothetical protein